MKNFSISSFLLPFGLMLFGIVTFAGCQSLWQPAPTSDGRMVLTSQSEVKISTPSEELAVIDLSLIPDEVEGVIGATETNNALITVQKNLNVGPPPPKFIALDGYDLATPEGVGDFIGSIVPVVSAVFPQAALYLGALEGIFTVFSKRKRQNYGLAVKNAATGNFSEAIRKAAAGLGVAHTEKAEESE